MSPKHWQWRTYFVALVVVEPNDLELRDAPYITKSVPCYLTKAKEKLAELRLKDI